MATTLVSDLKVYQDQFWAGFHERQAQMIEVFGAASNGALVLNRRTHPGAFVQRSFNKIVGNLVTRRDLTSTSAATPLKVTQDEKVSVKVHRKIGPVDWAQHAPAMIGSTLDEQLFLLGQQAAEDAMADFVNTCISAGSAAIAGVSALVHDAGSASITHSLLVKAKAKFGDRAGKIRAWVMDSEIYFNLVEQALADKQETVAAGVIIYGGLPATLGLSCIVTDAPSLNESGDRIVLGLVESAIEVTESSDQNMILDDITGQENLIKRLQAEHAFDVGVRGFKWDMTNGGENPDSSTIATSSNWDKVVTSHKDCAGVRLVVSAAA